MSGAQGVELSSLMKVQPEVGEATSNNSSYVVESYQDTLSNQHRLSKDNDPIYICPGNPPDLTRIQEGSGGGNKLPSQVDYEEEKTGYMVDKVPVNKHTQISRMHHWMWFLSWYHRKTVKRDGNIDLHIIHFV